jgi:hypothetical protein
MVMAGSCHGGLHSIGAEGDGAEPHARGVEDRIAEGGRHRRGRRFPDAERRLVQPLDQFEFERGDFGKGEDRVRGPVHRGHAVTIVDDLLVQRS